MSSSDVKDDVDRLFACFKCGLATPESARQLTKESGRRTGSCSRVRSESSGLCEISTHEEPRQQSARQPTSSKSVAININGQKHISPIIFYGPPNGAPVKSHSRLLRLLHEIRVDLNEQDNFSQREEIWATFPRQEEAIRFAKVHFRVHLFSYQDHLNGQRRFLVCTYEEFWKRYENMDPRVRHHYEVIQEGLPCHLYYDLEFNKKNNPDRNADEMVDILVSATFRVLFDKYSIQGNHDWIIELDSSTEEKFSRHLVVRIPQTAFKDNTHVGAFVSEICTWISSECGKDSQLQKLYIRKDANSVDSSQIFLDTAVYSRNRCFRLVSSSKSGKKSMLLPTGRFRCKNMSDREIFMDSLICRMEMDCKKLLVCKEDVGCKEILSFDFEVNENSGQCPNSSENTFLHSADNVTISCFTKSPFSALDSFIEFIASVGNSPGKIRSWYWFSAHGLMIYSMSRSRYCERIGREHKSNHVMYVVDLRSGVYYQKCHDPDCKGYRSPFRPLPKDMVFDAMAKCTSRSSGSKDDVVSMNLHRDEIVPGEDSFDYGERTTDSCNGDGGWWQEAIEYADHVENMREIPDICNQEEWEDDCHWWTNIDDFVSGVEDSLSVGK